MNGKKVEISLHTPIILETSESHEEKVKSDTVLKIRGVVAVFSEAGIQIEISELEDHRRNKVLSPHRVLFVPHHKIDHCFVL